MKDLIVTHPEMWERLTGELRWVLSGPDPLIPQHSPILQQCWRNNLEGKLEWRNVPLAYPRLVVREQEE